MFIYNGGKSLSYKTQTGVWDNITGKPIGVMKEGDLNWSDSVFTKTTTSVNGEPNVSADLQEIEIVIESTPDIQTKTRGVQAKVKEISFMLHLHGHIDRLFDIEGGRETILRRINKFTLQFFQDRVGQIEATTLDQDKGTQIRTLADQLKLEVNQFCRDNNYPFDIVNVVTIGDTELDPSYYAALAKKEIALLTQEALDVDANALLARIDKIGKALLKGTTYSDADRLQAAQITLGIVKKDIQFKKFGVDPDTGVLLKAIAEILKK
jgi:hypothetical protein